MLNDHAPFNRIISEQATATDRQWLRMLHDAFRDIDHEDLRQAGMASEFATEVLGLVALKARILDATD